MKRNPAPPPPRENITITLEELSVIWLKYNKPYQIPTAPSIAATPIPAEGVTEAAPGAPDVAGVPSPLDTPAHVPAPPPSTPAAPALASANFIRSVVDPYAKICIQQKALDGIYRLIELLDSEGGCPSIVIKSKDKSESDLESFRDILAKVTLRAHSHRTAMTGIEYLKKSYRDYQNLIPKMIVCALGHDIGKIPSFREGDRYSKHDHPIISADKVRELFTGTNEKWLDDALNVIRDHHRKSNEQFTCLLQRADAKARELEVAEAGMGFVAKEWDEWFDAKAILEIIKPEINVLQTGNKWKAFSFGGIVYCHADLFFEAAKKLAAMQKIVDLYLHSLREKDHCIRKVVDGLRITGAVSSEIGHEYTGRLYNVEMGQFGNRQQRLTPLKCEAFEKLPSDIDKDGFFHSIKGVKALMQ